MNLTQPQAVDYKKIYDIVLACGEEHQPQRFVRAAIEKLNQICPFDQALAYFMDGNGKVCGQ